MKRLLTLAVVLSAMSLLLVSCGKRRETLHIYNWGDYISEQVVRDFEQEFGCEVKIDTFDSNEAMYAKLQTGAGGYDIVVPSTYLAKLMFEEQMIDRLDHAKLPNVTKYFDRSYAKLTFDSDMTYTVPYFVSFTGIGYDSTQVKDFQPTWRMFERTDLKGSMSLLDDQREVLGCALATLGYSVNDTDQKHVDEAVALITRWKANIAKFGVDDTKQSLASGEFKLIQTYSGDMLQVMMEKPEIRFVIPKEGSTVTFDNFAIMRNSTNKDLAYAFINYIYRPEVAARNMDEIMYVTPHTEAVNQVDAALRANPAFTIPAEERQRCTPLDNLGDKKIIFDRAWDQVKSVE
ncbi:MAG: spermidine/putrescine ABC transporter substrate-binding protein [Oligosphaeraceae bacterium]